MHYIKWSNLHSHCNYNTIGKMSADHLDQHGHTPMTWQKLIKHAERKLAKKNAYSDCMMLISMLPDGNLQLILEENDE